ncbi:hypothetical protein Anapl_16234 [Anas platyrhynchos]|uniref:Uncharacterized protein n=1 Tax=Anas platyrhynchos TaxID=8839 RepID=R0JHI9_ANAPL|nr:hypothetical protein Anapl_16234 [Anas platyrhynchos]
MRAGRAEQREDSLKTLRGTAEPTGRLLRLKCERGKHKMDVEDARAELGGTAGCRAASNAPLLQRGKAPGTSVRTEKPNVTWDTELKLKSPRFCLKSRVLCAPVTRNDKVIANISQASQRSRSNKEHEKQLCKQSLSPGSAAQARLCPSAPAGDLRRSPLGQQRSALRQKWFRGSADGPEQLQPQAAAFSSSPLPPAALNPSIHHNRQLLGSDLTSLQPQDALPKQALFLKSACPPRQHLPQEMAAQKLLVQILHPKPTPGHTRMPPNLQADCLLKLYNVTLGDCFLLRATARAQLLQHKPVTPSNCELAFCVSGHVRLSSVLKAEFQVWNRVVFLFPHVQTIGSDHNKCRGLITAATGWKRRNVIIFVTPRADSWRLKEINPTSTSLVSKPPKKVNPGREILFLQEVSDFLLNFASIAEVPNQTQSFSIVSARCTAEQFLPYQLFSWPCIPIPHQPHPSCSAATD